jgi:hypothetical protein
MRADVSEKRMTSTFGVENQPNKSPACSRWLDTYGLGGGISQNMEEFITTAVRTSNPARRYLITITVERRIEITF